MATRQHLRKLFLQTNNLLEPLPTTLKCGNSGLSEKFFERLLTKKQLADLLEISTSYIDKLMALGEIPYLKIGKAVRFRQTEVLAWLQRRRKP